MRQFSFRNSFNELSKKTGIDVIMLPVFRLDTLVFLSSSVNTNNFDPPLFHGETDDLGARPCLKRLYINTGL